MATYRLAINGKHVNVCYLACPYGAATGQMAHKMRHACIYSSIISAVTLVDNQKSKKTGPKCAQLQINSISINPSAGNGFLGACTSNGARGKTAIVYILFHGS